MLRQPLFRKRGWLQSWSAGFGKETNLFPLPGSERLLGRPSGSLVTTMCLQGQYFSIRVYRYLLKMHILWSCTLMYVTYWGYLIILWLFNLGISCTVVVVTCTVVVVMCWCMYVCVGVLVIRVFVFTVFCLSVLCFLYCFVYVYLFLFVFSVLV
jgi:hypothetical protein